MKKPLNMIHGNAILIVISIIICLIFLQEAVHHEYPADVFPVWTIGITFVFLGLMVAQTFLTKETLQKMKPFEGLGNPVIWLVLAGSILYVYLIEVIGFYITSYVFLVIAMWALGDRQVTPKAIATNMGVSFVALALVYLTFKIFLAVPTPEGLLF